MIRIMVCRRIRRFRQSPKVFRFFAQGIPDWLLLKKGDTWTEPNESFSVICVFGRSASEPMLISSYGTGARPLLQSNNTSAVMTTNGVCPSGGNYLAIVGLEFYAYARDPSSSSFINPPPSGQSAIMFLNHINWLLIEDLTFRFYSVPISITHCCGDQYNNQNISLRRNIIVDLYDTTAHSGGVLLGQNTNLLIEENLFDHNGWNETVAGAGAAVFNHSIYLQGIDLPGDLTSMSGPATVRGNIFARESSGSQIRAGGTITNNLWVHNPYAHNIGMPSAFASVISNNVYLEGVDDPSAPYTQYGQGPQTFSSYMGDAYNIGTVSFLNNIIANSISTAGFGISLDSGSQGGTITGNIIYNWQNPIRNRGTGTVITNNNLDANGTNNNPGGLAPAEPFPDPTRSVDSRFPFGCASAKQE